MDAFTQRKKYLFLECLPKARQRSMYRGSRNAQIKSLFFWDLQNSRGDRKYICRQRPRKHTHIGNTPVRKCVEKIHMYPIYNHMLSKLWS